MKLFMIILAAGNSSRFGYNKLFFRIGQKAMYERTIERMRAISLSGCETKIYMVSQYKELLEGIKSDAEGIYNPYPQYGISYSIKLAIDKIKEKMKEEDVVMFSVCDQPYMRTDSLFGLIEGFIASHRGIGCPGTGQMLGNPVLFRKKYLEELYALEGDCGGKRVVRKHLEDVWMCEVSEKELEDLDMAPLVIVRGGGDLASGTIYHLKKEGYRVLVLETEAPACIRRQVAFCECIYEGKTIVEGMEAVRIQSEEEMKEAWKTEKIPVCVDAQGKWIETLLPQIVVDGILAKKNLGTTLDMAPLTIGLGPGFEAGVDVTAVIETMRGDSLGKIYYEGRALPNTGVPGVICGYSKERVIHAPADGVICYEKVVGEPVRKEEINAYIDEVPVRATMDGFLRGAIRPGYVVNKGLKIIDTDPRREEVKYCWQISDKAHCIAESVMKVIKEWEERICTSGM